MLPTSVPRCCNGSWCSASVGTFWYSYSSMHCKLLQPSEFPVTLPLAWGRFEELTARYSAAHIDPCAKWGFSCQLRFPHPWSPNSLAFGTIAME